MANISYNNLPRFSYTNTKSSLIKIIAVTNVNSILIIKLLITLELLLYSLWIVHVPISNIKRLLFIYLKF